MWRTNKKSDNIMRARAHDHLSMVSDDDECLVSFFVLAAVTLTVIPRLLAQLLLGMYSGILLFSLPPPTAAFLLTPRRWSEEPVPWFIVHMRWLSWRCLSISLFIAWHRTWFEKANHNNHFHHFHNNDPLSAHVAVSFILTFLSHFRVVCDFSGVTDFM